MYKLKFKIKYFNNILRNLDLREALKICYITFTNTLKQMCLLKTILSLCMYLCKRHYIFLYVNQFMMSSTIISLYLPRFSVSINEKGSKRQHSRLTPRATFHGLSLYCVLSTSHVSCGILLLQILLL